MNVINGSEPINGVFDWPNGLATLIGLMVQTQLMASLIGSMIYVSRHCSQGHRCEAVRHGHQYEAVRQGHQCEAVRQGHWCEAAYSSPNPFMACWAH